MASTRPRRSLLELFDPLAHSPDRDTSSPDSDKENAFDAASLFGQPDTKEHASPVKLRRRLIDIGDITTDDPSLLCMLTDEEELEDINDEDEKDPTINLQNLTPVRDNVKNPQFLTSISIIRTPLRELQLEQENAPVLNKTYKRSIIPSSPLALSPSTSTLPTISEAIGISSIIDQVNTSGVCFASPRHAQDVNPTNRHAQEGCDTTPEPAARESTPLHEASPEVALEISLNDVSHFESTPATGARLPASTLRPTKPDTSLQQNNRQSVDPHASFQLHLQSDEVSFDLLKDKISFFTSPSTDDNDTFDMSTELAKMKQIIAEAGLEEPSGNNGSTTETIAESVQEPIPPPQTPLLESRSSKTEQEGGAIRNAPAKPVSHMNIAKPAVFIPPPVLEKSQVPMAQSQSLKAGIPAVSRRSSLAMRGSAVPGLRIVKRANMGDHEKSASTSSLDPPALYMGSIMPVAPREQAPCGVSPIEKPIPSRLQRRVSVGLIGTTKPGTTGSMTGVKRLTVADRGRLSANPVTSQETTKSVARPRRVPISQGSSAMTLMNSDRGSLSKSTTTTGLRRVPISVPAANPTIEGLAPTARRAADSVGGLRAPVRQARPSVTGNGSVLPRPSLSRLPAPGASGIGRPSLGSAGRASGSAISGRNALPRRTVQ